MLGVNTMKDHRSLFRQLLTGMYDAVLITDPSGHLLEINPRAKEFFQYETDEVIDRPVSLFIPGVTPAIVQRIRAGLDQARHMMLDANCLRKDQTTFAAEVTVIVTFSERNVDYMLLMYGGAAGVFLLMLALNVRPILELLRNAKGLIRGR